MVEPHEQWSHPDKGESTSASWQDFVNPNEASQSEEEEASSSDDLDFSSAESLPEEESDPNRWPQLSPAQQLVLVALLEGHSITRAAQMAGINRSTVHRWMNDKEFANVLNTEQRALRVVITTQLVVKAQAAAQGIIKRLDDPDSLSFRDSMAFLKQLGFLNGEFPTSSDEQETERRNQVMMLVLEFADEARNVMLTYVSHSQREQLSAQLAKLLATRLKELAGLWL